MTAVWQQADGERSRKELDKARHDVERLRRALDKAAVEKRDQQQKVAATQQALQVWVFPGDSNADELRQKKEIVLWDAPCNSTLTPPPAPPPPPPLQDRHHRRFCKPAPDVYQGGSEEPAV